MREAIPDMDALVAHVLQHATHPHSTLHGVQHWQAVGRTGVELIEAGADANPAIVLLFALLHDSQRLTDGADRGHGPRASHFVRHELDPGLVRLGKEERRLLAQACHDHTSAGRSREPTMGTCFDADRLNLWRAGIWPEVKYLSTEFARDPACIERCSNRCLEPMSWDELYERYAAA